MMVEFEEDEAAILKFLRPLVKTDGCVVISDTVCIQELGMTEKQFFSAKNRLITGQVIAAWRETSGKAVIQLLVPEGAYSASQRYIFTILPLALVREVNALKAEYRRRILRQPPRTPPRSGSSQQQSSTHPPLNPPKRNYEREETHGLKALGVRKAGLPFPLRKP